MLHDEKLNTFSSLEGFLSFLNNRMEKNIVSFEYCLAHLEWARALFPEEVQAILFLGMMGIHCIYSGMILLSVLSNPVQEIGEKSKRNEKN